MWSRRRFLKGILAGLSLAAIEPWAALAAPQEGNPVLLALHLTGGNDALNTLVPYRMPAYRKARPNLALASKTLLPTDQNLALHPSLSNLHSSYQNGKVLLVPGVGREDHDRSHFVSSDIWHGAGEPGSSGWMARLGRKLGTPPVSIGATVSQAVACPDHPPIGLLGDRALQIAESSPLKQAWFQMYEDWKPQHKPATRLKQSAQVLEELGERLEGKMEGLKLASPFASNEFGRRFELAYRLLASGFPAQVLHLSAGRFDTHAAQLHSHSQQLAEFDQAVHSFLQNMESLNRPTTLLVYSEFGRRVSENFSGGTDHGAGGLAILMGDKVEGGIRGEYRLEQLRDGDLPTVVNYKELYRQSARLAFNKALIDLV